MLAIIAKKAASEVKGVVWISAIFYATCWSELRLPQRWKGKPLRR